LSSDITPIRHLIIRRTCHGKSVFAEHSFEQGDFILQFKGRAYSRIAYLRALKPGNCHFLQTGLDTFLGPSRSFGDYVNHCCRPNSGVRLTDGRAVLFAICEIHKGEEISFDYSTTMAEDHWEMDCTCGSNACRKRIRDFKHLPEALRTRYIQMGVVPGFVLKSLPYSKSSSNAEPQVPIPG